MSFDGDASFSEEKLNRIKLSILKAEKDNLQKREKPYEAMVETIKKIILHESKKSY